MRWRWGWPGHIGGEFGHKKPPRRTEGRFYGLSFRSTLIGVWRVDRRTIERVMTEAQ